MARILEYGSTLHQVTKENLDFNKEYRQYNHAFWTTTANDIKVGQIWLINDEDGEFEGDPFKVCPWCKEEI